jgi:hypothetical protein
MDHVVHILILPHVLCTSAEAQRRRLYASCRSYTGAYELDPSDDPHTAAVPAAAPHRSSAPSASTGKLAAGKSVAGRPAAGKPTARRQWVVKRRHEAMHDAVQDTPPDKLGQGDAHRPAIVSKRRAVQPDSGGADTATGKEVARLSAQLMDSRAEQAQLRAQVRQHQERLQAAETAAADTRASLTAAQKRCHECEQQRSHQESEVSCLP